MSSAQRVTITGIAAGGAGVGRLPEGVAIFVHRTAPGEVVEVEVLERKRRWARGRLLRILEAAPERRDAPCPHYARCGGCTLEHLHYAAQLRAKAGLVTEALRRIGGAAVEPPEVVASPAEFRYRNRVSFTLVRRAGKGVSAGFHELSHPDRILDITEACLLPEEPVARAWGGLRRNWGEGAHRLPSGQRLRLTIRASAEGRSALLVEGGYGPGRPDELLERLPDLAAVWHRPEGRRTPQLLAGAAAVTEAWQDEDVELGGGVFLQVNRSAAALLEEHVLGLAGEVAGRRVVDAYCGVGLHARRLARSGARVVGIELDGAALEEARRAAPAAEFLEGRVEERLPEALPAELVILNPPRGGLDAAVPERLAAAPPARLIYVSCDPATLARDVARLAPTFRLRAVRCFDLFPQTAHVETVAELTCATS